MSLTMTEDQMRELESRMNEEMEESLRQQRATIRQQLESAVEAKRYTASRDGGNGERIMLNREWDILDAKDVLAAISEILG